MSDFNVIRGVSRTLRGLLEDHITNDGDPALNGVPIDLRSPREMRDNANAQGISVWLYRVMRDANALNLPLDRKVVNQVPRKPFPVDCYYLLTPIANSPDDEQLLLGRVLQTFQDHPLLRGSDLRDSLQNTSEELRVTLETLSLEDLTRVWHSLGEPYQLSMSVLVQLVHIDSAHEPARVEPVLVKTTTYAQILSER